MRQATILPRIFAAGAKLHTQTTILARHSTPLRLPAIQQHRAYADLLKARPGPPRLAGEEQEEFERLVREANSGSFTKQLTPEEELAEIEALEAAEKERTTSMKKLSSDGFHPDYAGRTIPEFEGEVNPKTGEVGGPKQDPLRHGDYSFNGRVTDF
ncbi:uncharacterized protein V1518DRAFT_418540 [Limtongia smithiae]|uniref:uncharacterized protein n=1 Tax=Limtongia smithiae TaxID=1125753 RepID=UPI0034CE33D2